MSSQGDDTARPVETGWTDALIVCRKCARKHAEFGTDGKTSIRKALRIALRAVGLRGRVGLIQAGCFGVCPKRGVTVMQASRPGELAVVQSNDIDRLVASLQGQSFSGARGGGG